MNYYRNHLSILRKTTDLRFAKHAVFCACCLALLWVTGVCWAVQPYKPIHPDPFDEPWRVRSFPELNGLMVWSMVEDRDGNLWFGTSNGVRRYDGFKWTVYTQNDGLYGIRVNTLCVTQTGDLYAGTDAGISRFGGKTWERIFPKKGDLSWAVYDLLETSDGSVWAASYLGVLKLDVPDLILYAPPKTCEQLIKVAPWLQIRAIPDNIAPARPWPLGIGLTVVKGNLSGLHPGDSIQYVWAVVSGSPAESADIRTGDRIIRYELENGTTTLTVQRPEQPEPFAVTIKQKPGHFQDFQIRDIYEDRDGNLWFGLNEGEIVRLNKNHTWQLYSEADGLKVGKHPQIAQTRQGEIWAVANQSNVSLNRFDGKTWTHTRPEGWSAFNYCLLETRDGTLWVGEFSGFGAWRENRWTHYRNKALSLSSSRVTSLMETSDRALWVAQAGYGVRRIELDTSRWQTYNDLSFECETPAGTQWFIHRKGGCVRFDKKTWMHYGIEDGLMDQVNTILSTREGEVWAAGSHQNVAAAARFDGNRWSLKTHPKLAARIRQRSVFESADGALWFGSGGINQGKESVGGLLRYGPKDATSTAREWTHFRPLETSVPKFAYGFGQTPDGTIWVGGRSFHRFDGQTWTDVLDPPAITQAFHNVVSSDSEGNLWVGTRGYGVLHYNGTRKTWSRYDVLKGLPDNVVKSILHAKDGRVWVVTDKGISRFDGQTWTPHVLSPQLNANLHGLRQSKDGALWIIRNRGRQTVRYTPDTEPPETEITVSIDEVYAPGNTTIIWKGVDRWHVTPAEALEFSWRLDGDNWSPFSAKTNQLFPELPTGSHSFEVKARDLDFNEDPTPVMLRFGVIPPLWKRPWFVGLMAGLLGAIVLQTIRLLRRDQRLQETNQALSEANHELFSLNKNLEKANQQVEKANHRKSQFLASMSHELRTPMNAIIGFTRLVLRRRSENLTDRQRENLAKVQESADHLLGLINEVLDLSKIEAGRMEVIPKPFDVSQLVNSCCMNLEPYIQPGVTIGSEITEGVGEANTDGTRVRQILTNLLSNALKFTQSGKVNVKVDTEQTARGEEMLVIAVSDTGIGIPEASQETIFEEFSQVGSSQSDFQGTGLGLPITRAWTVLLGGRIELQSQIDKGSTFTVYIPLVYQPVD